MHSPWGFIFSVSKPFTRYVVGLLVVALGWSLVVNIQPFLIKLIIDTVASYKGDSILETLLPYVICYIGVGTGFITLFRYYDYIILHFIPKQKQFLVIKIMTRMMRHSASFYQKHFAGNLTSKINDVTLYTSEIIKILTDNFATCLCTLAFVLYNVGRVQARFAWALLVWLSLFIGISLWLFARNTHLANASAEARAHTMGHIVDMLINMPTIRFFVRSRYERNLLKKTTDQAVQKEQDRDRFFMRLHFFQGGSFWVFEALCFWWLLQGISAGVLTAGDFVLIFTLNLQILDQFWDLGSEIRDFWEKMGHLKQALKIIYAPSDMISLPHAQDLRVTKGDIVFENVTFAYEGSNTLFKNKSVRIQGGQTVGLVGYSGSGKSSFISLILRLYQVTSGRILIDGQDIQNVTLDSLYHAISIIPQDCPLFNRSLMDNIRYGRLEATDEEVYQAARDAHVHDIIQGLPHGYQTLAGEKGMRLSGGQRQRIAIARAFLKNAPILVLDEATSQLDALTENKLTESLSKLIKGKTVFIIAHRLATMTLTDRLLVFDDGNIVQDGTHDQLIHEEGLYANLWQAQSHVSTQE